MNLFLRSVILLGMGCPVWAQSEPPPKLGEDASLEFQVKKDMMEDRIADFYTRLILLERESLKREQGAEEARKERQRFKSDYEKARKEFVASRKTVAEPDPSAHEKELKEQKRQFESARKDYVRRRDEMQKFKKSMGDVPGDVEYDLNQEY